MNKYNQFYQNIIISIFTLCLLSINVFSKPLLEVKSKDVTFQVEKVAHGLGVVWGMTFINSKNILFTQRNGNIGILNTITQQISKVNHNLIIKHGGQGGLLDVVTSPDYKNTGLIYFTYVKELNGKGVTSLATAKLSKNKLINLKDIFVTKSSSSTSHHFGSSITFDEKGHLFFGVGERGIRANAQDLTNHAGSILRLNLDGSVPFDNPFVNDKNIQPQIYSYGHRNPQGIFYDKKNEKLYSIEHGPRGGDEINIILKGGNYGWPIISYGKEYWGPISVGEGTHKKGMEQPFKVYIPSIAPSSLIIYTGDKFPKWKGDLFAGALKLTHINRIKLDSKSHEVYEERLLKSLKERIREIIQSPDGLIYFSTDNGNIYKIKPKM